MEQLNAKSKYFEYKQMYNAEPEVIFPLLCFNREYEWIDGWQAKIIRSNSGFMEKDCIFISYMKPQQYDYLFSGEKEVVWNVFTHNKEKLLIESVNYVDKLFIIDFKIQCKKEENGKTSALFSHKYTGISDNGNIFIEKIISEEMFVKQQIFLEKSMNYFLKSGKLFKLG